MICVGGEDTIRSEENKKTHSNFHPSHSNGALIMLTLCEKASREAKVVGPRMGEEVSMKSASREMRESREITLRKWQD